MNVISLYCSNIVGDVLGCSHRMQTSPRLFLFQAMFKEQCPFGKFLDAAVSGTAVLSKLPGPQARMVDSYDYTL